jgi:hypothetical protein
VARRGAGGAVPGRGCTPRTGPSCTAASGRRCALPRRSRSSTASSCPTAR